MIGIAVCLSALVALVALFFAARYGGPTWRATTTPLASIIGSGFLVLGPLLDDSYGAYAPLVMAGLCGVAYAFGAAIRANIAALDAGTVRHPVQDQIETGASVVLAAAYVVSVAYYLNLFGAFGLSLIAGAGEDAPRWLTTTVYVLILGVGMTKGFAALERMEQVSVAIKLAVIAGLLVGLALFLSDAVAAGSVVLNPATVTGWSAVTLAFGLIVTVQGFETSRYLGASYSARMRNTSMRWAQILSAVIYMIYVSLLAFSFKAGTVSFSETAIIDMMALVAPVLPPLLVIAALSAQFSAAVADTGGSGGLIAELTRGRLSERGGYVLLVAVGLMLTWGLDVFGIIALASRAFALYYALQAALAALAARAAGRSGIGYGCLAAFGLIIAIFGKAVEG